MLTRYCLRRRRSPRETLVWVHPMDNDAKKVAAERFSRTMGRSLRIWRLIWSLQTYIAHGATAAEKGLLEAAAMTAREIIAGPDFGTEEQRQAATDTLPVNVAAAASNTMTDARTAASAANVVFAHSLLDAAVDEYCAVSAMLCPNDWLEFVDEGSVTLREVRAVPFDELLDKAISIHLKKLHNRSIVNRIKALQQVCRSGSAEILTNYAFDAERIERFDKLRNDIVHGGAFDQIDHDLSADLEFIERTNVYLSALITHRYGLLIGPEAMTEAVR